MMSRPVAISLSPNTFPDDVQAAFTTLVSPSAWRNEDTLVQITSSISNFLHGRFVVPTSSGRQALYDVLRVYGIGQGHEVIIQAFTCIAVPESVMWTGATPVYADIGAQTYNVSVESIREKICEHTRAIIVQHTFGIPGPIDEIVALAKENNSIVIEDCAHGFGGALNGRPLGTIGDAAIVSFGRDKMLSSVFGGAAVFSDTEHMKTAQGYGEHRPFPPAWWIVQQLLHPILFAAIVPAYFSGFGKISLVMAQKLKLLSKAVTTPERRGYKPNHVDWRFSPALGHLALRQLADFSARLTRRKQIVARYQQELANTSGILPTVPSHASPSWLRLPLQVENRNELLKQARKHHMLLGDWYDGPLAPSNASLTAFHYTPGMCPVAEQVSRHVINLPTYPRLTDSQVTDVIALVKQYARS